MADDIYYVTQIFRFMYRVVVEHYLHANNHAHICETRDLISGANILLDKYRDRIEEEDHDTVLIIAGGNNDNPNELIALAYEEIKRRYFNDSDSNKNNNSE